MNEIVENTSGTETWKTKTLIIGALIGAFIGIGGAYLLIQSTEKQGEKISISPSEGLKLGLLLIGLLRQIAHLRE